MNLFMEFDEIVRAFHREKIGYAVIGGFAVGMHGYIRATEDLDFMVAPNHIGRIQEVMDELGYLLPKNPWTFKDSKLTLWRFLRIRDNGDTVVIDMLVPNIDSHLQMIARAVTMPYSDISVKVVNREDLILLKQARLSSKDKIDIDYLRGKADE